MWENNQILCIGELLIDFICKDVNVSLVEGSNFIKKAGGAPANVTAAIARLGGKALFAGKVGNDPFGIFLKETLENTGVDTSMLILDKESNTTLAFVSLKSDGERDFVFNRGADERLFLEDLDLNKVLSSKIIHFGSATALLGGSSKKTYMKIMEMVKERGIFISFDPNYRSNLWGNRIDDFIEVSKNCLSFADFVKVSDEEIKIISNEKDIESGVEKFHRLGAKMVAVTLGKEGTLISNEEESKKIESLKVKSIDSTGAGDAFVGAALFRIAQLEDSKKLVGDFDELKSIIKFANRVGAIACTKLGAIASLPTLDEVKVFEER